MCRLLNSKNKRLQCPKTRLKPIQTNQRRSVEVREQGRKPNVTKVRSRAYSGRTILAACENVDVGRRSSACFEADASKAASKHSISSLIASWATRSRMLAS